jgi:hypothetical protein
MLISRISPLTGQTNQLNLPVTIQQLLAWEKGGLIQNVMPNLSDDEREFLLTGLTSADWETLCQDRKADEEMDHFNALNDEPAF